MHYESIERGLLYGQAQKHYWSESGDKFVYFDTQYGQYRHGGGVDDTVNLGADCNAVCSQFNMNDCDGWCN